MWHKSNAFGPANCRAKACGRDIKRAVAIWRKFAVIPTTAAPGEQFHTTRPGESWRHETNRAARARHAQWRQVYDLVRAHTTNLALFKLTKLISEIASYKEHIVRSKGEARVIVLSNGRFCTRIICSAAGKTGDMPAGVAGNSDLIDVSDRASSCAANEQRIWIVILKRKTAVVGLNSGHQAQAD